MLGGPVFFHNDDISGRGSAKGTEDFLSRFVADGRVLRSEWEFKEDDLKPSERADYFWNKADNKLIIGDFNKLVEFIISNSGKKDSIEKVADEK